MAEVRKFDSPNAETDDFAPSEIYIVVLSQDDNETLCKYADGFDHDKQPALQSIINGSFFFLKEVVD